MNQILYYVRSVWSAPALLPGGLSNNMMDFMLLNPDRFYPHYWKQQAAQWRKWWVMIGDRG